jgi:hypothetical protein
MGERVVITRRGKPYVVIGPPASEKVDVPRVLKEMAQHLKKCPGVAWNGKNLHGLSLSRPTRLRGSGPSISEMIIEARRSR